MAMRCRALFSRLKPLGESIERIPGELNSLRIADPPIRLLDREQIPE
jgi:hypothetical protein